MTRPASDPIFDARYRVAIMYDNVALKPIAIAIEKATHEIERNDLPTFCTRKLWVRTDQRRATSVMDLRVNGEIVVPMHGVQVFMADWGQSPRKMVLNHEQYVAIAGSNIMPKSDDDLWNALHLIPPEH